MSKRHELSRSSNPGYAKVPKPARQMDHRRERRAAKEALLVADPDEVVVPEKRSPAPPPPEPLAEDGAAVDEAPRKRWRHWKQPFWKRRTNERRRRAELLNGDGTA